MNAADADAADSLAPRLPAGEFAAFIFDCDGTLAATMHQHYRSWLRAIEMQGGGFAPSWEEFCSMGGMSVEDTLAAWEQRYGVALDPARVRADTDAFLETVFHEMRPCAAVVAVARAAVARGVKVAVASGGVRRRVLRTLRVIGLENFFPVVLAQEDVARVKPAPDLFLLAAQKLGVLPEQCLVFEDSPKGKEAADAAGMHCVLVEPQ
ncbi:MAG: HAD family phosphatase [Puniceicoccales bacterium]|jgi:HAD superfamily hydrolase (TIGR01509 family)|nr:HAD family phosphatase [Puniceicoccales bacterium]